MGHYESFDPTPRRAHRRTLASLHPGEKVMEVGCSNGALTQRIQALGCRVVGIENRPTAAEEARPFCERVIVGDIERLELGSDLGPFDVILLIDVLEHLIDPTAILRRLAPLLTPGGRFIVALPNIAHWSIRWQILRGQFNYTDSGILDRTHLHLYTMRTARELLESAGLQIIEADLIPDVPFLRYKRRLVELNYRVASLLPNLFATESFFVAEPRGTHASP